MSADNWAVCPRCLDRARRANAAEHERVNAGYGVIPLDEFERARAALTDVDPEKFHTFREYYEFCGAEDGAITASYRGGCEECGLECSFAEVRQFYAPGTES